MILLAAAATAVSLALGGDPSVVPIPVGPGPRYRPAAVVRDGRPLGTLRCGSAGRTFRVHLELFAHRKVVIVPPGIGAARNGCVYAARTSTPTGIVEVANGARSSGLATCSASGARGSGRTRCSRSGRTSQCGPTWRASATTDPRRRSR